MSPRYTPDIPPSPPKRPMRGEGMRSRHPLTPEAVPKPNETEAKKVRIDKLKDDWESSKMKLDTISGKIRRFEDEIEQVNKRRGLGRNDALVDLKWTTEERETREEMELVIGNSIPDLEKYATLAQEFDQLNKEIGEGRREKRMVIYFFEEFYKPAKQYGLVKALKILEKIKERFGLEAPPS